MVCRSEYRDKDGGKQLAWAALSKGQVCTKPYLVCILICHRIILEGGRWRDLRLFLESRGNFCNDDRKCSLEYEIVPE
jgi:hypothetical protein